VAGVPNSNPVTTILISHFFSRYNKGDAALATTLISELRKQFDRPQMSLLTLEQTSPGEMFEGLPMESSFFYYSSFRFTSKWRKFAYSLLMLSTTLAYCWCLRWFSVKLWLPKEVRHVVQRYVDADLIVAVGGGYLLGGKTPKSIYTTIHLLHPMILSRILGKPTVLFSQSFGPYKYGVERQLLRHVVTRCVVLALAREDQSLQFLSNIGVSNATRSVDSAFLLSANGATSNLRQDLGLSHNQLIIGVTVRDWLDPVGQDRYEDAIAGVVDYLISEHGAFIVFIPQVTATFFNDDDRVTARSVAKRVIHKDGNYLLEVELDCHQLKAVYEDIDFLIGTRFHSVIFSLISRVPSLVVQYNYKAGGIMLDLGLGEWVVNIEDCTTPTLAALVSQLLDSQQAYKAHLDSVIPPYQERAREAAVLTQRAYDSFAIRNCRRLG
jgi:colanic acid/amylovoran biosynthesis protein